MKVRFLSVVAAAALLAACETAPTTTATTTDAGRVETAQPQVAPGPQPGSQADLVATAGDRVFFGFDRYDLSPEARAILDRQAAWLRQYPNVNIVIEGHADERGTREYNLALGERRANSVRDYLVAAGIPANRIRVISYGKERPVALGSNEAAWSQNRRGVTVVQ
ncbi:peptidoglycan-associated lipoprotein Pal [Telmatospirillum sp. J64-1]|uniref:peptidoglycan-associated lipoprotein Pal n=1 Tax=Telmatospirillum sp. J64-1 TaxID=2502183 RepID=UPI00115D158A|nr:peptidoglycan-associated lipoprotein Pal [Telmatospirillum sp. J64-1]